MRLTLTLGAVLSVLAVAASAAAAAAPPGPRLATIEMIETKGSERDENASSPLMSLTTIGLNGEHRRRIVRGKLEKGVPATPGPFNGPAWSPDGKLLAFTGSEGERNGRIYLVSPDGSGLHAIPGTKGATHPVFSPDGHTLAFSRFRFRIHIDKEHLLEPGKDKSSFYASGTTWVIDLDGGKAERLTRWRNGLSQTPGSFSADGSVLALTKNDSNLDGPRIVLMRLDGSGSAELVRLAEEPAVSPDGLQVAFVGYLNPDPVEAEENQDYAAGDIYVAGIDGTHVRRLSKTDDVLESSPRWDPSGRRIAYIQFAADTSFVAGLAMLFPFGNALMEMNADGTCRERVLSVRRVAMYGVSWQPGPGREAGPITC